MPSAPNNNNNNKPDLTVNKTASKFGPAMTFKPKTLTFNFVGSGYRPRDPRRLSQEIKVTDPIKPITHSSVLSFLDFVELFKSFSLRCRKDLKDLFEQFATPKPSLEKKLPKELLGNTPSSKDSGRLHTVFTLSYQL